MNILSSLPWIVFLFLILWISYRYLTAAENPWKKAGIPVLTGWASLLASINFNIFPLHLGLQENYKKCGKLFGLHSYGNTILYVGEPDLIRLILVKDFQHFMDRFDARIGDPLVENMMSMAHHVQWKRIRTAASPTFSTGKIKRMTRIILDCAETLNKNFEKEASLKSSSDVKRFISAFTIDSIATTAFGTKLDSLNDLDNPFMKAFTQLFSPMAQFKSLAILTINNLLNFVHLNSLNFGLFSFFEKMTRSIIEERKKRGHKRNDFLQLMLDSSTGSADDGDDDAEDDTTETKSQDSSSIKEHKVLNDDEMMAVCIEFLISGFETIASTVSFAIYELAINEHVQEDLISEIDEVLRMNQKELTYENVQNMKYMDNVVFETLRKYPPGIFTQRLAQTDYEVPDMNLVIPKDTIVVIPIYAMQHDEEYFPNPETFDPNRFTAEEKSHRDPYVYLPFGVGPRNCVAMRFALFEVKLCLASLLSRYRFRRCQKTQVPLQFPYVQPQLVANDIFLTPLKREDAVV